MNTTDPALRLRLKALRCPLQTDDLSSRDELQQLIVWLEDTHIRRLPIPERSPLRNKDFEKPLGDYLQALASPLPPSASLPEILRYLVDVALSLHYSDNAATYNTPIDPWQGRRIPVVPGSASSPYVRSAVERLMRTMNIPYKLPDASAGMRVAAREVRESCHRSADENVYKNELTALPLGFDTNDDKTNQAATVIRVLYAHRLRALQDEINALLSKMQAVTSNPNTDSKLGKVGR